MNMNRYSVQPWNNVCLRSDINIYIYIYIATLFMNLAPEDWNRGGTREQEIDAHPAGGMSQERVHRGALTKRGGEEGD